MTTIKRRVKLFTGCVIPNRLPFLERSARLVLEKLGFHLEDAPFTCCPDPVGIAAISEKTWLTLAARNLYLGEKDNTEILSLCNGCSETLVMANHSLKQDCFFIKADFSDGVAKAKSTQSPDMHPNPN